MKIEILKLSEIKPYIGNAKQHPDWHIKQIASSIQEFGFNDPIAIDENNTIIEGHGRAMAAELLKLETVPVIKLTHMSEAQRKAYIIAHNKLTMNTDFDFEKLRVELDELEVMDFDLDLTGLNIAELNTALNRDGNNINNEWQGMPEFNQDDMSYRKLIIHFEDEIAVGGFIDLIGQPITDKTKFIWYPEKKPENLKPYEVVDAT